MNLKELNVYEVRYVFTKALDVWAKHSKLTFTEVDSDRADILIYFHRGEHGDNFAFDGPGQILAHAFFPGSGRGGDAHFDLDENWSTREDDEEGTSLFHVAAHEFGHSLGLSHSSEEGALMYPWYQGMQNGFNYDLPADDRLGIQSLYGTYQEKMWAQNPGYRPGPTMPPRSNASTRYTPPIVTFTTPKSRPQIPPRPPQYPDYPRYPRPPNPPNYPKKYPENNTPNPEKPYNPRKPMHPDKKNTPKYPNYNPYYPDRSYPTKYPKQIPDRRYPNKYPQFPDHKPESTTNIYTNERRNDDKYPERRRPYHPKEEAPPDTCNTSYDAISVIRGEVFIFKDKYFWRIGDNGLQPGYPAEIKRLWKGLPKNFTHVDAAYETPNNKLVFFIGKQYYQYTGNNLNSGYPRPLTDLGLPASLEKIDAAMVWGHNGKTYIYSGNMYWRFDEDIQKVELDYPRDMSMWRGVGTNIDAVFQWKDGKTYFFKGNGFWRFNDLRMRVEKEQKMLSGPFWMGCSRNLEGAIPGKKAPHSVALSSDNSCGVTSFSIFLLVFSITMQLYQKII